MRHKLCVIARVIHPPQYFSYCLSKFYTNAKGILIETNDFPNNAGPMKAVIEFPSEETKKKNILSRPMQRLPKVSFQHSLTSEHPIYTFCPKSRLPSRVPPHHGANQRSQGQLAREPHRSSHTYQGTRTAERWLCRDCRSWFHRSGGSARGWST